MSEGRDAAPARPRRVHELLDAAVAARPQAAAVTDPAGTWTWAELSGAVRGCAGWLAERGVGTGSRVVVVAATDRRVVALLYACSVLDACFVPLAPDSGERYRRQVVADCGPDLVLTDADALPPHALLTAAEAPAPPPATPPPPTPAAGPEADQDGPALLIYTSGSTGSPKGVVCPHPQVLSACSAIAERLRYQADDVVLCRLPLSFDYGLYQVLLCALAACRLVLAGPGGDLGLLATARRTGVTVVPLVPSLADLLLRLARRDTGPTRIRLFTNTGEALAPAARAALRERFAGARVQLMFGITECKRVAIMEPDGDLARPHAVGRPLTGTTVDILGPGGEPLPTGETGEITVTGPHVMAGYWRAPELTRRTFRPDGPGGRVRLHTGDFGRLDADGYLYFAGRRDDVFKSNGVRTSVAEIESAARDVPGVTEAAFLPPGAGGPAVLYAVTDLTPEAVLRAVRRLLGPDKAPARCLVAPALPHGPNGKIDRAALRTRQESR
ncbi:class I adenylate-forming enzyme family protein [Streptantibioticus silvisoli]|uniref:AMP-binding protein n=1 Tax=Streptantibioticus silvisoli TaxID=2705255 RepID=A0ABT6VRT3_9ACTN|nr:AMP-binding protein [Streptantibioticus silvisoli]MDI5961185.1 AMP-binding protein [Streptantibioticus silvisoli]